MIFLMGTDNLSHGWRTSSQVLLFLKDTEIVFTGRFPLAIYMKVIFLTILFTGCQVLLWNKPIKSH